MSCKHCGNCEIGKMIKRLVALSDRPKAGFLTAANRAEIDDIAACLRAHCLKCKIADTDRSGHGQSFVSIDAAPDPDLVMRQAEGDAEYLPEIIIERDQPQALTRLDLETEQIFRRRIHEIFSLDLLRVLFIWHVMRGGKLTEFDRTVAEVRRLCDGKWSVQRTFCLKESMIKTFPALAGLYAGYKQRQIARKRNAPG